MAAVGKVMETFSKVAKVAGKMAPWLGALSGIFGIVDMFIPKPSPQDAVDAANKAIAKLTEEVCIS